MKRVTSPKNIALTALFTAVTAVCAQMCIPLPNGVSLTLQTFAVALCGYILGIFKGTAAVALYIAIGLCGLPVFSAFSGGFSALSGPTGGFIVGFIPFVILCGAAMGKRPVKALTLGGIGVVLCHISGIFYFTLLTHTAVPSAFIAVSAPYLAKDILCVSAAYFISRRIKRII